MKPGTRLDHYEIVDKIGEGGMGAVYRARDARLGREVAVKVLPEQFASDPERLARFEQEARAAAALNHPHIAQVFDVGAVGDVHYFVQELLEGRSLREVLEAGPMELGKVQEIGGEIASALRAAHAAGVVHRDLKPENVFVTSDGYSKVLDFGLAKLVEGGSAAGEFAESPTLLGTQLGVVMGTAGYMAPEQVNAGTVDHRADLFALGCLLYEMALGRRAFPGDNVHDVLNRVLSQDPDLSSSPGVTPRLRWLLQKATAKDPEARYQSAADLAIDLGAAFEEAPEESRVGPGPEGRSGLAMRTFALAGLALAAGLLTGSLVRSWLSAPPAVERGTFRFAVPLPREGTGGYYNRALAVSPDGRLIAMMAGAGAGVWLHDLQRDEGRILAASAADRVPFFSPDGGSLGYWGGGQFHRLDLARETVVPVGRTGGRPFGVNWAEDGFIYYGHAGAGIWRIPGGGGDSEQVVELEAGLHAHGPELLPGGEWLLFTLARAVSGWRSAEIVAQSLVTGERRVLVNRGRAARYVPGGFLVWVRDQTLMADTFDLEQMSLGGRAAVLEQNILTANREYTGAANYDFSRNGVLVHLSGGQQTLQQIEVYRDKQALVRLPLAAKRYGALRYSPDDRKLAAEVLQDDTSHLVVYDLTRESEVRISTGTYNSNPVWSPDGRWLYYATLNEGSFDIVRRRIDLSAEPESIRATPADEIPAAVSSDGEWLYFETRAGSNSDIGRLNLRADSDPELIVSSPADESGATVSPDGRFLAFQSDVTDAWGVYVLNLESRARDLVSGSKTSYNPVWARSGDRIYFNAVDGVYVTQIDAAAEVTSTVPRRFVSGRVLGTFDVTRDGGGILVSVPRTFELGSQAVAIDQSAGLHVVVGWFDELRQIFDSSSVR